MPPPPAPPLPPCKAEACAIQSCLAANDYQQRRCVASIAALIACCDAEAGAAAAAAAPQAAPVHCSFSPSYRRVVEQEQEQKRRGAGG